MLTEVKGLVIRVVDWSDNDKLLTLFTEEYGKITAIANGSRTLKSRYLAASQLFCYGSYVLYEKGDRYWIREVNLIESFFDLRTDLSRVALATYLCEVAADTVEENAPEPELLRLTLNSLYAIAKKTTPLSKIKAAFEWRGASLLGFRPLLGGCAYCGGGKGEMFLDVMNGTLECAACREGRKDTYEINQDEIRTARIICPLSQGALDAVRYVVSCTQERLHAFSLPPEDDTLFCAAAEKYFLNQLERSFQSLDFYKQVEN